MKSPRGSFLQNAGIAAAMAPARPVQAFDLQGEAASKALPEAIAKLKSRKSEAKPITAGERRERLDCARQLMVMNKIDAIMLMGGNSLVYFTGNHWFISEHFFSIVVPAKADPFYVCPAFEEDRAVEQVALGVNMGNKPDVRLWQEDESRYDRVAQGLKERGVAAGTLGVEETVRFVFSQGVGAGTAQLNAHVSQQVAGTLPALKMVSATPVTAGCPMIKSKHELELMTLANQGTLPQYEDATLSAKNDMTQPH